MNSYFRLARNMALKSPSKFRLGAVVVKRHKIISTGFNIMTKTHPIMEKLTEKKYPGFSVGLHAEIHACIGIPVIDLEGSSIYIYRILRDESSALAKPCKLCEKFLRGVGVKRGFFSTKRGFSEIEF